MMPASFQGDKGFSFTLEEEKKRSSAAFFTCDSKVACVLKLEAASHAISSVQTLWLIPTKKWFGKFL